MNEPPADALASAGGAETFGPYRLGERLGRGGMGEVHRAYDTRRNRWVALKRLTPDVAEDAEIRERFERECRVAARLASPHVVPIHDFGVIEGRLFLDMRLIEGRDLGRLLYEEGPLDPHRAIALVEQLAGALDAAHADGLVHRDVKPGNALVTTERGQDFVHLVDFGIVRLVQGATRHRLTEVGTAIGTLAYMAPEQIEDASVDLRADVYALAAVLFEALTGQPPFTGEMPQLLRQHLSVAPAAPSTLRPGLPPALDAVVLRGLAKRPEDRFPSAGALADAARDALVGAPGPGTTPLLGPGAPRTPGGPGTTSPVPQRSQETLVGPVASGNHTGWPGGPPTDRSGPLAPGSPSGNGGAGPPDEPAPPTRRGRRRLVLIALAAVVAVVLAAGTVVLLLPADETPVAIAAAATTTPLTASFPTSIPCSDASPASFRSGTTGVTPVAVRRCTRNGITSAYLRWPTPTDSERRIEAYRDSASVDGQRTWSAGGTVQGAYYQTLSSGQCTIVAAYTGLNQAVQVYGPGERCADVRSTFDTLGLPTGEQLRGVTAVFDSSRPGCGPTAASPGAGGAAAREVRLCATGEGATVAYSRWESSAQVVGEANARRADAGGGPAAWTSTDGRRQGSYVRTEEGGTCRVFLGWDVAPYAVDVAAPDCDVADRTVARLAPPVTTDLPT